MSQQQKTKKAMDRNLERDIRDMERGVRKEISPVVQEYLRAIVDTKNAKKVGVPTDIGGHPGNTAILRLKSENTFWTGTAGNGFFTCSPVGFGNGAAYVLGPFSDVGTMTYTTASYAGAAIPAKGAALPVGMFRNNFTSSPWQMSSLTARSQFQYRLVGCTLEIFPTSSFADQNGTLHLYEIEGHAAVNEVVAFTPADIKNYNATRSIRGTQTGAQSEKIVLNWHPQSLFTDEESYNDFQFMAASPGATPNATTPLINGLVVYATGATNTEFAVIVHAMYEIKGSSVINKKARLVDSAGMDDVMNAMARKHISGYVARPEHAYKGYLAAAWEQGKRLAGWVKDHEREIADGAGRAMKTIAGFL